MSTDKHAIALRTAADLSRARKRLFAWVVVLLASACTFDDSGGGCGDSLINNYRFDRWCGDELCNWTTLTGPESIRKVPTWHENDHGVELLATPTVLTQRRSISGVSCLELSMVADVDASADVTVGIDYNFDGDAEDPADEADVSLDVAVDEEWTLPPARWKKLTFLSSTPEHYSGVRFVIRKRGEGRAVLAEVRAQSSDQCTAPRPAAEDLPLGVTCDTRSQCLNPTARYCTVSTSTRWNLAWCTLAAVPQWLCDGTGWRAHCASTTPEVGCETITWSDWCVIMFDDPVACDIPEPEPPLIVPGEGPGNCSECATDDDCASPNVCGLVIGSRGRYRSCVPVAAVGSRCSDDNQCVSQRCIPLWGYTFSDLSTCAECASDDECTDGSVCGLNPALPARACVEAASKPLSTICEADAECRSGICCGGRCSECCLEQQGSCTSCTSITSSRDGVRRTTPYVCQDRVRQPSGAECLSGADCVSGQCHGTEDVCSDQQHCLGSECASDPDPDCFLITIAGTCQ